MFIKNSILERKGQQYKVVCVDEDYACLCPSYVEVDSQGFHQGRVTAFTSAELYDVNDNPTELGFKEIDVLKKDIWF